MATKHKNKMKKEKTYLAKAQETTKQKTVQEKKKGIRSLLNPVIISIVAVYILILVVYSLNYAPLKLRQDSLQKDKDTMVSSLLGADGSGIIAGV